jgi:hypothetical protein
MGRDLPAINPLKILPYSDPLFASGAKVALPERPAFDLSVALAQSEQLVGGRTVHVLD